MYMLTTHPIRLNPCLGAIRQTDRQFKLLSTLVISKSNGPSETRQDIRTSTYQMCRIQENTNRKPNFTNELVI